VRHWTYLALLVVLIWMTVAPGDMSYWRTGILVLLGLTVYGDSLSRRKKR